MTEEPATAGAGGSLFASHQQSNTSNKPQQIMADHAEDDDFDGDNIFIYRGGRAPQHITHARIDKSILEIKDNAFYSCVHLLTVETHDGLRRVGRYAFYNCKILGRINLESIVEIEEYAFDKCVNLEFAEFGDRLETIGKYAFRGCISLKHLKLPSIITIAAAAFTYCKHLIDVKLPERLETIGADAFKFCGSLQRIAVPLKRDLFEFSFLFGNYIQFDGCEQLTTVDLVGGVDKTVASLHMESWRSEIIAEINRIKQVLPNISTWQKTDAIRRWMELVLDKLDHYKAEHYRYVKEGITLLELAVWKAKLGEKDEYAVERKSKKAKVDIESARKRKRVTCGADVVIKNVLPFLQLE